MYAENLLRSTQILEQNEDIIDSIIQNLQLGRYNDCIQLYNLLHSSIINIGVELDNFPEENGDPYATLSNLPDEIMKKNLLQEHAKISSSELHSLPTHNALPTTCTLCEPRHISTEDCRCILGHVEPSAKLTSQEQEEFLQVARLLAARPKQKIERREYKRWDKHEKYSVLVGLSVFQDRVASIAHALGRRESQLNAYLARLPRDVLEDAKAGRLPEAPMGYLAPPALEKYVLERMKAVVQATLAPRRPFADLLVCATNGDYSLPVPPSTSSNNTPMPTSPPGLPPPPRLPSISAAMAPFSIPSDIRLPPPPVFKSTAPVTTKPPAIIHKDHHSHKEALAAATTIAALKDSASLSDSDEHIIFVTKESTIAVTRPKKRKATETQQPVIENPPKKKVTTKAPKSPKAPKVPRVTKAGGAKTSKRKTKNVLLSPVPLGSPSFTMFEGCHPLQGQHSLYPGAMMGGDVTRGAGGEGGGDFMLIPNMGEELSFM